MRIAALKERAFMPRVLARMRWLLVLGLAGACHSTPKSVPLGDPPASSPSPGIYGLQTLIDFDSLDGVAISGTAGIVLFGHKRRPHEVYPIAYLDHLATAMECESPMIDLRWAPGSEKEVDAALNLDDRKVLDRLGHVMDSKGHLLRESLWLFQAGGADVKAGMNAYELCAAVLKATGHPKDADALLSCNRYVDAVERGAIANQTEATARIEDLCYYLGVWDEAKDVADRYRAGSLTKVEMLDEVMPILIRALARLFRQDPDRHVGRYRSERARGGSPDVADDIIASIMSRENQKEYVRQILFEELLGKIEEAYVPPERCADVLGVVPRVTPSFGTLPPTSLMARVAFEADVFGKLLMVMPQLKKAVPRYRTYFEWRRADRSPATDKEGHLWFAPDGFELLESADGKTFTIGRAPVRIHLEKYVQGKSVKDPALDRYAEELTSLYDDVAREYPILDELRECMKIVAVASWLKKRGVKLQLPTEGRARWTPPAEIPGIVQIVLGGKKNAGMIWALGGVDFDGSRTHGTLPGWKFSRGGADPVPIPEHAIMSPLERDDRQLRGVVHGLKIVEPPEFGTPMRGDPGWCCEAKVGKRDRERVLEFVSVALHDGLDRKLDYVAIAAQRERVLQKAKWLEHCDKLLNARTKSRVDKMVELQRLAKESDEGFKEIRKQFRDQLEDLVLQSNRLRVEATGGAAFADKRKLQKLAEDLHELDGHIHEATELLQGWKEGKQEAALRNAFARKLGDLGGELGKCLLEASDTHLGDELARNAGPVAKMVKTLVNVENKAFELRDIQLRRAELDDELGDLEGHRGPGQENVHGLCKTRVDEFETELRKLKELCDK